MVWVKICGITNEEDAKKISGLGVDALGFILSTDSPRRVDVEKVKKIIESLKSKGKKGKCKDGSVVSTVGVFVNEEVEKVLEIAEELDLDYIQFSGDEDKDYLKKIGSGIGRICIRSSTDKKELAATENNNAINVINSLKVSSKGIKIIKSIRIKDNIVTKESIGVKDSPNINMKNDALRIGKYISEGMESLRELVDFFLFDTFKKDVYGGTGESFNWGIIENLSQKFPIILSGGLDARNVKQAINKVKPFGVDASSGLEVYPGKKNLEKVERFVKIAKLKSCLCIKDENGTKRNRGECCKEAKKSKKI